MTAAQLLVLALLAAAFAAGWIARRDGSSRSDAAWRDLTTHVAGAREALARAIAAYGQARAAALAARNRGAIDEASETRHALDGAAVSLERVHRDLVERLGPAHPLAEDCGQATEALALLSQELSRVAAGGGLDTRALGPVESAARDAQARFNRSAAAVLLLDTARPAAD